MSVDVSLLPMVCVEDGPHAGVVTLTLEQAGRPVVVLDQALLRAIDASLDEIDHRWGPSMTGLVLASAAPRSFVAGANLKEIMELDDPGLHAYLSFGADVFQRFAAMPVTTVAAINSAVLGGGLELAMHCDVLIGAEPPEKAYLVGLPEAGLGICPGWGGTNLLPARMDATQAIERTATGRAMKTPDASASGLLTELVAPDALLERARTLAKTPKSAPRTRPLCISDEAEPVRAALTVARERLDDKDPERAVLACVERGLDAGWDEAIALEREELVRLRSTDAGRAAIEAFFAKSAKG